MVKEIKIGQSAAKTPTGVRFNDYLEREYCRNLFSMGNGRYSFYCYIKEYINVTLPSYKDDLRKKVIWYDGNKQIVFNSITEAAKELKISQSLASRLCSGKRTSKKYNLQYKL